jgi:hypothetical protein
LKEYTVESTDFSKTENSDPFAAPSNGTPWEF